MHSNLSDDPNEVLEQGLPPLVSDYSCSRIAQDVATEGLDGTEVARQIKGRKRPYVGELARMYT